MNLLNTFIKNEFDDADLITIKVKYAFEVIKNETIKFIFLFLYFFMINHAMEFIFCFILLCPLRMQSGGIHMWSNISCLVFTFAVFKIAICWMNEILIFHSSIKILILTVSFVLINIIGPIPHKKKMFKTKFKYIKCQKKLLIISIAEFSILLLIRNTAYFQGGLWVVVIQFVQLIPALKSRKIMKESIV